MAESLSPGNLPTKRLGAEQSAPQSLGPQRLDTPAMQALVRDAREAQKPHTLLQKAKHVIRRVTARPATLSSRESVYQTNPGKPPDYTRIYAGRQYLDFLPPTSPENIEHNKRIEALRREIGQLKNDQ